MEIQVKRIFIFPREKTPIKNKKEYSKTARESLPERLSVSTTDLPNPSVWDSRLQRLPLMVPTLIRNAHSPLTSPSEERSSRVWLSPRKWLEPSSSERITYTTLKNITDTKKDIETSPFTAPQLSKSRKVISFSSDNADHSPRLSDSTSWRLSQMKSSDP